MFSLKVPLAFQNRSLMLLLGARISTSIAFQMLSVAVGWQIYSLTQMPFYLGLVGLVQFLPIFLLTLVVGYVADSYDRKLIIFFIQIVESIGIFLLAFESYNGWITKEGILVTIFFIGIANAFQGPSMQSLLPNVVRKELFPEGSCFSNLYVPVCNHCRSSNWRSVLCIKSRTCVLFSWYIIIGDKCYYFIHFNKERAAKL